tara:strand:+ start:213 stop:797 length:585 start_codon:yes stop_codon:yes gene_type:complete
MRIFLSLLILIFFLQSWSKADDIREFEIEGISIGDSLLNHFSETELNNQKKNWYPSKKFYVIYLPKNSNKNNMYDAVGASLKNNDNKYKTYSISGIIFFDNNIDECNSLKDDIVSDLSKLFQNTTEKVDEGTFTLNSDTSGKSTANTFNFEFKSGDLISVQCYDWSNEMKYSDRLKVTIVAKEYNEFTLNEVYN